MYMYPKYKYEVSRTRAPRRPPSMRQGFSHMTLLALALTLLASRAVLGFNITSAGGSFPVPATPKCSASAPSLTARDDKLTRCKVLVVGGGPGGLFSAYILRHLGKELCVVDRSTHGADTQRVPNVPAGTGKMLDYPGTDAEGQTTGVVGSCGLRISEAQTDLRCLASRLNVSLEDSAFDDMIYTRGEWHRTLQEFVGTFKVKAANPDETDLYTRLLEYALVISDSTAPLNLSNAYPNPLTGQFSDPHPYTSCQNFSRVMEYLQWAVGPEAADFLMAGNSLRGDWKNPLDVCQYIAFWRVDWNRCCTDLYPTGGWSAIWMALRAEIKATGVRFFPGYTASCLYDVPAKPGAANPNSTYVVTSYTGTGSKGRVGWAADRLIVNIGPSDLTGISGPLAEKLKSDPHMQGIYPVDVVIYNAHYPERFWEPYRVFPGENLRVVTDSSCTVRSEFPGNAYLKPQNASRPIYSDDPQCVAQWKAMYAAGGIQAIRDKVRLDMQFFFPNATIPEPTSEVYSERPNSWHYVKPYQTRLNVTCETITAWAKRPLGKSNLCMVGEAYNIVDSGWAAAGFKSAMYCAESAMADLMTEAAAADLNYIATGCNNAPLPFPTEIPPNTVYRKSLETNEQLGSKQQDYLGPRHPGIRGRFRP